MTSKTGEFECVLPDGRFASIRRAKWGDILAMLNAKEMMMPALASRLATLDGESYTPEQWAEFDLEDIAPVINELNKRLANIGDRKGVA